MSSSASPPPSFAEPSSRSPEDVRHSPPSPDAFPCQWQECTSNFDDPELLYNHLCNDHIGRKSTNNLCLTCRWKDCNTSCAKRDHITSHLRVHTPLKPHVCEICKKSFKRPQDLKKHEKIHTEEHHVQHRHSKAITVSDPAYLSRVRSDPTSHQRSLSNRPLATKPSSVVHPSIIPSHCKAQFLRPRPPSDSLPTPSPDIDRTLPHHSRHISLSGHEPYSQAHTAWDGHKLAPHMAPAPIRHKRALEYSVDDFFTDMKKRKVNPSYDSHMAERLNSIAYTHDGSQRDAFNPRSVSFDVRTPEELAAVNEFLLALGRDVTSVHHRPNQSHGHSHDLVTPQLGSSGTDRFSPASYFDSHTLSQLGIAGMPGMPAASSAATFAHEAAYPTMAMSESTYNAPSSTYSSPPTFERSSHSHPSVQSQPYTPMYTPVNSYPGESCVGYPSSTNATASVNAGALTSLSPSSYARPTPPLDPTSPYSASSTPSSATPPHAHTVLTNALQFDFSRVSSRGLQPPAQLAPPDHSRKIMHDIALLKSAPCNISELVDSRPSGGMSTSKSDPLLRLHPIAYGSETASKGSDAGFGSKSQPSMSGSTSGKLYPLVPEDLDLRLPSLRHQSDMASRFRLPPIAEMYRSPSPSVSRSPGAAYPSPVPHSPPATRSPLSSTSASARPSICSTYHSPPTPRSHAHSPTTSRGTTPSSTRSSPMPEHHAQHEQDLARGVCQIELEPYCGSGSEGDSGGGGGVDCGEVSYAQRRLHAELIRDLLVTINLDYKHRHRTPKLMDNTTSGTAAVIKRETLDSPCISDAEMVAV